MKKILFILLLISSFVCSAQFNSVFPSKAVLKNGDTLNGILGKLKKNTFKYKTHSKAKPQEIEFSEIDFVQIRYSKNDIKTFKFFQLANSNIYIPVEEFIVGGTQELYGRVFHRNVAVAGGGSYAMTVVKYYLKKRNELKLTEIGVYDPIMSDYTTRVQNYFSDCPNLIEQIENKNLRFKHGLEPMVEYYNNNCDLQ